MPVDLMKFSWSGSVRFCARGLADLLAEVGLTQSFWPGGSAWA